VDDELYRENLMDHYRHPRNHGTLEHPDCEAEGKNPLCGDHVEIALQVEDDRITAVRFVGHGCAISKASASLMTQAVQGKTRAEAEALFQRFHALVLGQDPNGGKDLGQLVVFSGVSRFPVRVKCASLAWHTLKAALASEAPGELPAAVSTE
jgi:nitrogen fixation NifU-like protein